MAYSTSILRIDTQITQQYTEWVSPFLLGLAVMYIGGTGYPVKLPRLFRLCERAAPATRRGRARNLEGARAQTDSDSPSAEPGGAEIGGEAAERKRAEWKTKHDL